SAAVELEQQVAVGGKAAAGFPRGFGEAAQRLAVWLQAAAGPDGAIVHPVVQVAQLVLELDVRREPVLELVADLVLGALEALERRIAIIKTALDATNAGQRR